MEQRSEEWKEYRRGKITASRFGDVLASPTTKRYQGYLLDVVNEINGVPDLSDDDPPWFRHGKEWEEEARGMFSFEMDLEVTEVGSLEHPKYDFISCSPDGLIPAKESGLEIKCRKVLKAYLKNKDMPESSYQPQLQGCMWIAGVERWYFVNYFRTADGTKRLLSHVVIAADKGYQERLEAACLTFWEKVKEGIR